MALRRALGAKSKVNPSPSIAGGPRDALALRPAGQMKLPAAVAAVMAQRDGRRRRCGNGIRLRREPHLPSAHA